MIVDLDSRTIERSTPAEARPDRPANLDGGEHP